VTLDGGIFRKGFPAVSFFLQRARNCFLKKAQLQFFKQNKKKERF